MATIGQLFLNLCVLNVAGSFTTMKWYTDMNRNRLIKLINKWYNSTPKSKNRLAIYRQLCDDFFSLEIKDIFESVVYEMVWKGFIKEQKKNTK